MARPWLSVVMPTYNGAAYLEAALDSVLAQQDADIEVIAVDDGSTDRTPAILQGYSGRLQMTLVQRNHGGNWVASTNHGMSLARGQYFCWLHQDDTWCEGRLAVVKRIVEERPDASFIVHPVWFINAAGRRLGAWRCPLGRQERLIPPPKVLERLLVQNFFAPSSPVFKAEACNRVGELDEGLWYLADWDFWLRLSARFSTYYHPTQLACCRLHSGAQTTTCSTRIDDVTEQYAAVLRRHLGEQELNQASPSGLGRIARFSADVNLALMRTAGGKKGACLRLLGRFARLGPRGWWTYLRDSRVLERAASRLRAGVLSASQKDQRQHAIGPRQSREVCGGCGR